ncbi:MAG: TlpA family protein disulfide reductase [Thermoplasmata archaeon]
MTSMRRCPVCGSPVKPENLTRHLRKVHPGEEPESHMPKERRLKARRGISRREGTVYAVIALAIIAIVILAVVYQGSRQSLVGEHAPSFTVIDVQTNTQYTLPSSFRGELVFVEFFSTTCRYCIEFIPTMRDLYLTYNPAPHYVNFISININKQNDTEDLKEFVAKHPGSDWTHSLDISDAADDYKVQGTPHLFIIDLDEDPENGIVKYDHPGKATYDEIASVLNDLLGI